MLIQGDAAIIPLKDKSVHCIVTSPPYWGLRKYAGEQGRGLFPNLGLEKTPQEHIEHLVEIMREVRRVLRDDGVVWLNYGDCYAGSWGNYGSRDGGQREKTTENFQRKAYEFNKDRPPTSYYQQGNLMLMPHRIAIALQDDGWIVRNDLIWYKRNPMPESVAGWRWERSKKIVKDETRGREDWRLGANDNPQRDHSPDGEFAQPEYEYGDDYVLKKGSWRHTRQHEYIFQLVKSMGYYSNQEAVREEGTSSEYDRTQRQMGRMDGNKYLNDGVGYNPSPSLGTATSGRNPRSVLDVPTSPYKGAHYATFPPNLIAPLIRASCPRRCCPECGQAWAPVVEKPQLNYDERLELSSPTFTDPLINKGFRKDGKRSTSGQAYQDWRDANPPQIIDYRPTCECNREDYVPGIVLDPFLGSGTTVFVAKQLLRRGIGLDISMEYLDEQAKVRAKISTPSNQFDNLPMFEGFDAT